MYTVSDKPTDVCLPHLAYAFQCKINLVNSGTTLFHLILDVFNRVMSICKVSLLAS